MYSVHNNADRAEYEVFDVRNPGDVVYVHVEVLRDVYRIQFNRERTHVEDKLVGTHDEGPDPRVVLFNFPAPGPLLFLLAVVLLFARNLILSRSATIIRKWKVCGLNRLNTGYVCTLEWFKVRSYGDLVGYFPEWNV